MSKEKLTIIILVALFVISSPAVFSIGISPPTVKMDYVPDKRYDFTVNVINNGDREIPIEVRVQGELEGLVAVKMPIVLPPGGSASVPIAVTAPSKLDKPGYHTSYVFFTEKVPDESSGTFSVRTEVGLRLMLWQPYPGQYAEVVASADSVAEGQDTRLKLLVNNLGDQAITGGSATVKISTATGDVKDILTFSSIDVAGNSNKDYYKTILSSKYQPGKYYLDAELKYGENTTTSRNSFAVGTQDVEITSIEGPIYLDKAVNKYTVVVESLWNQPLENVFATVQIGSSSSRTSPISLNPFGVSGLLGYWETDSSVQPGQALASVKVQFTGGEKEALLPITIYNETPLPPTYESPDKKYVELNAADLIFIGIALILVVVLIIFATHRMSKKEEGPKGPSAQEIKTNSTASQNNSQTSNSQTSNSQNPK